MRESRHQALYLTCVSKFIFHYKAIENVMQIHHKRRYVGENFQRNFRFEEIQNLKATNYIPAVIHLFSEACLLVYCS